MYFSSRTKAKKMKSNDHKKGAAKALFKGKK
jgi:hypothetical protein